MSMVSDVVQKASKKVQWPSWLTLGLGLLGGVLVYLNQQKSLGLGPEWSQLVKYGIIIIGTFVGPLVGSAFRNALPLSHRVVTMIATVAGVLAAAASTLDVSSPVKGILLGAIAFLTWAGFGPGLPEPVYVKVPAEVRARGGKRKYD